MTPATSKEKNLLFISLSNYQTLHNSIHLDVLNFLKNKFDNIFIFCLGKKFYQKEENIHYFSGNFWQWYFKLKKLPTLDFVYINDFFVGGTFGIYAKKRKKARLVFRCGSPWKYELNSPSAIFKTIIIILTKPLVIKSCDKVVYNSKAIVQHQYKHNWEVVYNGVDTELFRPMKIKKISDKLNLIFVGNLNKEKGLDYLFEAVKDLTNKIHLTIVGDGPLFKSYIKKYPFVHFIGRTSHLELPKIINQHDVLVLPTFVESFPNVILEAMACGKPAIATNIYGIPEMIQDNVNGFLVPPKYSKAIKEKINLFMKQQELVKKMGEKGRKLVEKKFERMEQAQLFCKRLFLNYK